MAGIDLDSRLTERLAYLQTLTPEDVLEIEEVRGDLIRSGILDEDGQIVELTEGVCHEYQPK